MRKVKSKRAAKTAPVKRTHAKVIRMKKGSSRVDVWAITICVVLFLAIFLVVGSASHQQQTNTHASSGNENPSIITPTFVCVGNGSCASGAPTPSVVSMSGMPSPVAVSGSPIPLATSGQANGTVSPSVTMPQTSGVPTISGIVLPSIPQVSGTPPSGADRDKLHQLVDQIERQLDALEKKVSAAIHKQIDVIEKAIDKFEQWLLGK